ncbi:MAG: hypothetical protein GY903_01050 [Fuerstiella sp.]|nr:hypothetical protein [Fuerstiella sp.]MCP4853065.1 hypothetical protein [Fuerstiella sp.]
MYKLELFDHESESTAFTTTGASVAECAAELMLAIQDHAGTDAAEYLPVISEGLQMLFSAFVDAEGPCRISNPEMSGQGFDLVLSHYTANAKHTAGPWRQGHGSFVISDNPAPGLQGSDDVAHYGGHLICESVSNANAALIAAAPDMLDALHAARHAHATFMDTTPSGQTSDQYDAMCKVHAAIRKATDQ